MLSPGFYVLGTTTDWVEDKRELCALGIPALGDINGAIDSMCGTIDSFLTVHELSFNCFNLCSFLCGSLRLARRRAPATPQSRRNGGEGCGFGV